MHTNQKLNTKLRHKIFSTRPYTEGRIEANRIEKISNISRQESIDFQGHYLRGQENSSFYYFCHCYLSKWYRESV